MIKGTLLNKEIDPKAVLLIALACVLCLVYFILFVCVGSAISVGRDTIVIVSWVGLLEILISLIIWKKLTGQYFNLFSIFLSFVAVFNFGQCILWALGIIDSSQIISCILYRTIECTYSDIAKAQILFLMAYIVLNCGGICGYNVRKDCRKQMNNLQFDTELQIILYRTSLVLACFSVPLTLFGVIQNFVYGQIYSYHDLYYGSISNDLNSPLLVLASALFIPSLLGLLLGSQYNRATRRNVYIIFFLYALISLLCGDRGEWVQPLLILVWADLYFYKKRSARSILLVVVLCFFSLYLINALVSVRNIGLSLDSFLWALSQEENPLVELLEEFGTSMSVTIIVLKDSIGALYGDSFFMSIPTVLSTSLWNSISGTEYVQVSQWFPFEYLGLNFGTDFSLIAEPVLNYGVYFAPVVYFIEGYFVAKLISCITDKNSSLLFQCLALASLVFIVKYARSTFWYVLYNVFWTVVPFLIVYFFIKSIHLARSKSVKHNYVSE